MSELGPMVASLVAQVAQLCVGLTFAYAVAGKLREPGAYVRAVEGYRLLPTRLAPGAAMSLLMSELLVAIGFLTGQWLIVAAPLALLLLTVFLAAVASVLVRGREVPCGCLGDPTEVVSGRTVARLFVLIIASTLCVAAMVGRGDLTAPVQPVDLLLQGRSFELLGTLLLSAFALCATAWVFQVAAVIRLVFAGSRNARTPSLTRTDRHT